MNDGRVTSESTPPASEIITADDVADTHECLDGVVHRTPLDNLRTIADRCGVERVDFKLENVQWMGSFKTRGAYNAMAQLPELVHERGIITPSVGNHVRGVALAGDLLDIDTTTVVPEITSVVEIDTTRGYGADVVVEGELYEESYERALWLIEDEGLKFAHPFDDAAVIVGQEIVGQETMADTPGVDTILVSIGGDGLISSTATVMQAQDPEVRVIGVQPEDAAHARSSLEANGIRMLSVVDTAAEGITDVRLLERVFMAIHDRVDDVVSVGGTDLAVATTALAQQAETVIEPAGTAPVAALLSGAVDVEDEHVAAVVSGGNVDLPEHAELTCVGIQTLGCAVETRLELDGWPAALGDLSEAVATSGAEFDSVERAARTASDAPNRVPVEARLDGSGPDHLADVLDSLSAPDGVEVVLHSLDEYGESTESP